MAAESYFLSTCAQFSQFVFSLLDPWDSRAVKIKPNTKAWTSTAFVLSFILILQKQPKNKTKSIFRQLLTSHDQWQYMGQPHQLKLYVSKGMFETLKCFPWFRKCRISFPPQYILKINFLPSLTYVAWNYQCESMPRTTVWRQMTQDMRLDFTNKR